MGVRYIFSNTCSNIMKFLCKTGVFYPSSKKKKTNIFINVANKYLLLGGGGGGSSREVVWSGVIW